MQADYVDIVERKTVPAAVVAETQAIVVEHWGVQSAVVAALK